MNEKPITEVVYQSLQSAFDYFDKHLFDAVLPDVLITLNRKSGTHGYFSADRFIEKIKTSHDGTVLVNGKKKTKSEIALNPDTFGRSSTQILSTLVHEMCHHWQHTHGNSPKTRKYHNKEWVDKMRSMGLSPVSKTTSKGTGIDVAHEIEIDGKFHLTVTKFLLKNKKFDLGYTSEYTGGWIPKFYTKHSFRYECPECGVWAKAPKNTKLVCEDCLENMICVDTNLRRAFKKIRDEFIDMPV